MECTVAWSRIGFLTLVAYLPLVAVANAAPTQASATIPNRPSLGNSERAVAVTPNATGNHVLVRPQLLRANAAATAGTTFTPTQTPNLQAWFDASTSASIGQTSGLVTTWGDLSGNNNSLGQTSSAQRPSYVAAGINNLGSVSFNGNAYLFGSNASFSVNLFNESTVFVVSNESTVANVGSLAWTGVPLGDPRWSLNLSTNVNATLFDFNNKEAGRVRPTNVPSGPAMWTAAGSVSKASQILHKNGRSLASTAGPQASVSGNYPLSVGATYAPGVAPSYLFKGQIGEIVMFSRFLSSTETVQVETYLACKWGLQSQLPYAVVCPGPSGPALQDPPQIRSQNQQLTFSLTVQADPTTGHPQYSYTYNGVTSTVPPTLRVLPGDTLAVNLKNNLPPPPSGAAYLNDTNLHFHGLHVSPNAPADDSIDMIAMPGQSLQYTVPIPSTHSTGLYWYHSHAHGEAERQNLSGMSGALIVDGISQAAPQVATMTERVLVVRDALPAGSILPAANIPQVKAMLWAMQHGKHKAMKAGMPMHGMSMDVPVRGTSTRQTRNPYVVYDPAFRRYVRTAATTTAHCTGAETASHVWTVNGQTAPSIGILPGEKQFWRLVNAGSDTYLDLQVDNTQMQIVALDGVPVANAASPTSVNHYVVAPASRVEFVVTGPAAGTTAYLRTNCFDAGSAGPAMPAAILASLNSSASAGAALRHRDRVSAKIKARPLAAGRLTAAYIKALAITGPSQTVSYSDQNTINGQSYDPAGPPLFYAQSGTTALWTIANASSQVHTFHIHQVHFVVQSVTGGTQSDQSNVGQLMDNVNVPAANANGPGSVTLKMDFTDPLIVGTFLLHCHILSHEDAGMMAKIRIGTAPPMTVSSASLNFSSPTAASQTVTVSGGTAPYSPSGCANVANASVNGSTVTISPSGKGSCVLTIADSSGLVASVSVNVAAPPPAVAVSPNSLGFASPTSPAQNATISGGTAPYSVTGCSGIASAVTSGNGLRVTPQAAGQCTLSVVDAVNNSANVAVQVNSVVSSNLLDNVTFHQNNARNGWYRNEPTLTATNVASTTFKLQGTFTAPSGLPAFGKVYSQPLFAAGETIAGIAHNLVIISTATDQVYAFDDATRQLVWHRSFTSPPGITQQSWSDTGCADVNPDVGIVGTPVIDRNLDEMFVVVPTKENGTFHIRLHAISLQNGSDKLTPTEVSGSVQLSGGGVASTSAKTNFNRGALLEANGNIYVALGSHCDYFSSATHGWILAYGVSNLLPSGNIINTTNVGGSSYFLGSPWMAGFGPASDSQGSLYFATGNGPWDGVNSFAMSVMKVPGNLDLASATYFTPAGEAADSNKDQDLGSGGVMLLPDGLSTSYPHLLIQGGKCGAGSTSGGTTGCQKYILNRDNMGGKSAGDSGAVWHADTAGKMFGGPAYFQDAQGVSHIVYGGGSPLSTYNLNLSPISLSTQSAANVGCLECRDAGSQPVVSSNGTKAGTAVVWALKTSGSSGGPIVLYAFDALNMSHTLFSAQAGTWTVGSGASSVAGALVSPLVANGIVYVPTDGSVAVFGLR